MRIKNVLSAACMVAFSLQGSTTFAQQATLPAPIRYTPWQSIAEKDIPVKKRVWRQLDAKDNPTLFAPTTDGNLSFAAILMNGIRDGYITAYAPTNDRFTNTLTFDELTASIGKLGTINRITDPATGQELNECVNAANLLSAIHQYRIKEDWLTVDGKPEQVVSVLGIAPVVSITDENGITTEQPLFWFYYFDNREYLSRYIIPADEAGKTWLEFFEGRQFSSSVTRVVESKKYRYQTK